MRWWTAAERGRAKGGYAARPRRVNGRFRAECLNAHWFRSLADTEEKVEDCRNDYNEKRPLAAIGNQPPILLHKHDGAVSPLPWQSRKNLTSGGPNFRLNAVGSDEQWLWWCQRGTMRQAHCERW